MSLHARKHGVVGYEKQMGKTASQRPSLISIFVIRSLLNSIAKEVRPEISLLLLVPVAGHAGFRLT